MLKQKTKMMHVVIVPTCLKHLEFSYFQGFRTDIVSHIVTQYLKYVKTINNLVMF